MINNCHSERKFSKHDLFNYAIPTAISSVGTYFVADKLSDFGCDCYDRIDKTLPKNDKLAKTINEASDKVFNFLNLKSKGVMLLRVPVKGIDDYPAAYNEILSIINSDENNYVDSILKKEFLDGVKTEKTLQERMDLIADVKTGNRAVFFPNKKLVLVPDKNENLAVFHEIGHAVNEHISKLGKSLSVLRDIAYPIGIGLTCAALLTPVLKEEECDNKIKKTLKTIQDNGGKLCFLVAIPVILEEAMASYNGEKAAKNFLDSNTMQIVKKSNKNALLSYVITYLGLSIGVSAGVKIKKAITGFMKKNRL